MCVCMYIYVCVCVCVLHVFLEVKYLRLLIRPPPSLQAWYKLLVEKVK
jgi:hypothetical protein